MSTQIKISTRRRSDCLEAKTNVPKLLNELPRLRVIRVRTSHNTTQNSDMYFMKATGKRYLEVTTGDAYTIQSNGFKLDGTHSVDVKQVYEIHHVNAQLEILSVGDEIL